MKNDLNDVTFLFIVRLDSIDRLENILSSIDVLMSNFDTNIEVLECCPYNNKVLEKLLSSNIHYCFKKDDDPILYRTKFLNEMILKVRTPYVSVWDVDVVAPTQQIIDSIQVLRNDKYDMVYPYEFDFLDTTHILRKLYLSKDKDINILFSNMDKMEKLYPPKPVGGAFFCKTETYIESGMENESFYGWGVEDGERMSRWKNLGYRIGRIKGPLFHLSHIRSVNSVIHNQDQTFIKLKAWAETNNITNYKTT